MIFFYKIMYAYTSMNYRWYTCSEIICATYVHKWFDFRVYVWYPFLCHNAVPFR